MPKKGRPNGKGPQVYVSSVSTPRWMHESHTRPPMRKKTKQRPLTSCLAYHRYSSTALQYNTDGGGASASVSASASASDKTHISISATTKRNTEAILRSHLFWQCSDWGDVWMAIQLNTRTCGVVIAAVRLFVHGNARCIEPAFQKHHFLFKRSEFRENTRHGVHEIRDVLQHT